jgi:hypothetical protein
VKEKGVAGNNEEEEEKEKEECVAMLLLSSGHCGGWRSVGRGAREGGRG